MRYVKIQVGYQNPILIPVNATSVGSLLEGLANASVYSKGYEKNSRYKLSEEKIEISFLSDIEFEDIPEPIKKLSSELESANIRWLEEYNKRTALEQDVKELRKKLASVANVASNKEEYEPPTSPDDF